MARWDKCPKCQGLLHLDRDEYGWYMECFMCGFTQDMKEYTSPAQRKLVDVRRDPVGDKSA